MKFPRKLKKAIRKDSLIQEAGIDCLVRGIPRPNNLPKMTIGDKKRINKWIRKCLLKLRIV